MYAMSMSKPCQLPSPGSRWAMPGWSSLTPMGSVAHSSTPAARRRSSIEGGPMWKSRTQEKASTSRMITPTATSRHGASEPPQPGAS
jgi:hypothetical protein